MRVVTVNGTPVVAGLKWRMKDGSTRNEIYADVRAGHMHDRICLLEDRYGVVELGSVRGKPVSLAALYAMSATDQVSMYALSDDAGSPFYWVAGIRGRNLSLRSDVVLDTRDEALEFLASLQESTGVERTEVLEPEESVERIRQFLASRTSRKASRLLLVNDLTPGRLLVSLGGIVGCLCLLYGGYALHDSYAKHQLIAQAEARKSKAEAQAQDVIDHPEKYFSAKWMTAAPAKFSIVHGLAALMETPLSSNGWKMVSSSVNGTVQKTQWEITPFGNFTHLPDNARLDGKSVSKAVSVRSLHLQMPEPGRRELLPSGEAERRIYDVTHAFSLNSSVKFAKRQSKTIQKVKIECPWVVAAVKFDKIPAVLAGEGMNLASALDIPGLVINEISYGGGSWSLKGELYANAK